MSSLNEYLNITLKVFTILPFLLFTILKSGRRKIAELPVFDFLIIMVLGAIVGADISDPKLKYFPTAYAIILVILLYNVVVFFKLKYRKFSKMTTFGPTVVIQNGKILHENMKRIKYTTENIMMFLRQKDVFDLSEVEFAIIEDNGNMSVLKKSQYMPVTPKDMNIPTKYKGVSIPLVIEGKIHDNNLKKLNLSREWLYKEFKMSGIETEKDIFYAEINTDNHLYISKRIELDGITTEFKIC
ncbi:DUF421 domain-containing protein [Clostridium oceanicum]|uniref:DUF421 domain-containing protein n=1 Tax=Clostridium oceanicum TaxID=1543 RepID=A0ABN1JLD6_9CLOT